MASTPTRNIVFIGDSVTDCGRLDDPAGRLGNGYVRLIAEYLADRAPDFTVINRGISGNRAADILARWEEDCLALAPAIVSILVGINDTWRRYDSNDPTSTETFADTYRALLLALTRQHPAARIVLIEPFLLPVRLDQAIMFEDLDPKVDVIRELATEFDAILVPAEIRLTEIAGSKDPGALADDGVHPTGLGHRALADLWLKEVNIGCLTSNQRIGP